MNKPTTPADNQTAPVPVGSGAVLGGGLCDDCGGRIGTTCSCPIGSETTYLFQGIPAMVNQWATIESGTLNEMLCEKHDYETQTGLFWRGYRIIKAVTTYHTNVEPIICHECELIGKQNCPEHGGKTSDVAEPPNATS